MELRQGRADGRRRAGPVVDVWYAAPALTFIDGSMGFSRQKHRGRTAVYSVLGVLVALAVAVIIFAAMGG